MMPSTTTRKALLAIVIVLLAVEVRLVMSGSSPWMIATVASLSLFAVLTGGLMWMIPILVHNAILVWNQALFVEPGREDDNEWTAMHPVDHPSIMWMAAVILRELRWVEIHPDSVDAATLRVRVYEQEGEHERG